MRSFHCLYSTTKFKGINPFANRIIDLRRFLGVLLVIHLQHKRYGECSNKKGEQSCRNFCQKIESQWNCSGPPAVKPSWYNFYVVFHIKFTELIILTHLGKLVFPSVHNSGHFSMLGLGDIVMPGLLLCFVLRYDSYKKSQCGTIVEAGVPPPKNILRSRLTYFQCSLLG